MPTHVPAALTGLAMAFAPQGPLEIHVTAPPGRAPDVALAVDSLPAALAALRERRGDGDAGAARVVVHGDRHELAAPLAIDATLAGDGLAIEAAAGANPVISGGFAITGLRDAGDGTWRATLDDVRAGGWWFEELFAGLEPRTRARHPDAGFARVVDPGGDNRTSFTYDPAELPPGLLDARSEVVFLHDWSTSRIRIAGVAAGDSLRLAEPIGCKAPHYAITNFERHPRFFVEGSPRLADAPGEWALDRETGELVYRPLPTERIEEARLVAPFAPALLRIEGSPEQRVANVVVRGLGFAHVAWNVPPHGYAEGQAAFYEQRGRPDDDGIRVCVPAAIELSWAAGCRVEGCTVAAVGGTGLRLGEGCRDCAVVDTVVRDCGANGIMIGHGQADEASAAAGNGVRRCLVERCGRRFFGAVGVWIGLAQRTTVARCEIRDLPYTGVSVGWRWDARPTPCRENVIEHNHIHDVMRTLSDGGGIYTLGLQPGTVLRGNAIHDVLRNAGRAPSNGIFFDQGTKELLVEGNVLWNIDTTPLRWHLTHDNAVRGNTFVLREGQQVARYDGARAADIVAADNHTPDAAIWSPAAAAAIVADAGPRR